ncbi:MAG: hypothetical protein K6G42_03515 [Lachnospiraceae bacterium]|nr:hypothetical protein [Lachnospiraceae bacterium]
MPVPLGEINDQDVFGEDYNPDLATIENKFIEAANDTGRSALYYKVRDAIALYRNEVDEDARINMMLAVRESAFNYLMEKKGNAPTRKRVCRDIVRMVDAYASRNGISKERDLSYLINQENISDKKLDMEIRLAGKLIVKDDDEFKGDLKDHRKAFRSKIADVKFAGVLKEALIHNDRWALRHMDSVRNEYKVFNNTRNEAYDDAVRSVVSGYMNVDRLGINLAGMDKEALRAVGELKVQQRQLGTNMLVRLSAPDEENADRLQAKGHMIEGILADILKWDPSEFAFDKPEDFLNRSTKRQGKGKHFLELYNKLRIADNSDVLLNELKYMQDNRKYTATFDEDMFREIEARLNFYKEVRREYEDRLKMMNSPYYALLTKEDMADYDTPEKINLLGRDKSVRGVRGKKSVGEGFKSFLRSLRSKITRLGSNRKTGGEFTRKTDVNKLLNWHRKRVNASTRDIARRVDLYTSLVNSNLESENRNRDESWLLENNRREAARPAEEADAGDQEVQEHNAEQEVPVQNENVRQEANAVNQEANAVNQEANAVNQEANAVNQEAHAGEQEVQGHNAEQEVPVQNENARQEANAEAVAAPEQNENARQEANAGDQEANAGDQEANAEEVISPEEELKNKQAEIMQHAQETVADIEAKLNKQRDDFIKKELEEEKKRKAQLQKEIVEKRNSITSKSKAWNDKLDEKEDNRLYLTFMAGEYENLTKNNLSVEKAFDLHERMVTRLINFTGIEKKFIELISVDKLAEFVNYVIKNQYVENSQEKLKEQIIALHDKNSKETSDSLLDRVKKLMEKGDEMTVHDKLLAYEYNTRLIHLNRSQKDGDAAYKDYAGIDLKNLTRAAEYDLRYYSTLPGEKESFDTMPEKKARDHEETCRQIAAAYTGKDPDYFRVLPLSELSELVFTMNNIKNKEASEAAAEKCLKHAEETHARIRTIDEALDQNERNGIISAIENLSGVTADELKGCATRELRDVLVSMYTDVSSPETLSSQTKWLVAENSKRLSTDYYEARLKDSHKKVWLSRDLDTDTDDDYFDSEIATDVDREDVIDIKLAKEADSDLASEDDSEIIDDLDLKLEGDHKESADFEDLRAMAEYSILYLQQHKGFEDLKFDDFAGLSPDEVYYIYRNVGIIEEFKDTVNEYEMNDRAKAIGELANMEMPPKLKSALEKTLNVNFETDVRFIQMNESPHFAGGMKLTEWKKPAWMIKQEQKEALKKRPISEREKSVKAKLNVEEMLLEESYRRWFDELRKDKKSSQEAKVVERDNREFSREAGNMLNILGDITLLSGQSALDSDMAGKVGQILSNRAGELVRLLNYDSAKIMKAASVFGELKTGVGEEEKSFFESFESSLMPVINALSEELSRSKDESKDKSKNKKELSKEEAVIKVISSGKLDKEIQGLVDKLETNLDMFEKKVIPVMKNATSDIYNKGEEGENIPTIMDLMDDDIKELVNAIDEETHRHRLAEAKTTKERVELQKKPKEQADKERGKLNDMQESLLYDSKKGQGRFNQLLISGYYENASKADQRKMLSFIVRDMKKKGKYTTDKEKGCEYFAATMKGAGPLMQKMMQGIPERMVIPEMSVALGVVKSSLAHIDKEYVDKVFDDIQKSSKGTITSISRRESLGAASVAETFKCTIAGPKMEPNEVVVKILRPDAKKNMKEDFNFVRRAAMFADMSDAEMEQYTQKNGTKLVDHDVKVTESGFLAQFSEIEKEFDFTNEVSNCELGKKNYVNKYNKKKDGTDNYHVKSVEINKKIKPKQNYLVMNMASGTTVDKIIGQTDKACKGVESVFRNTDDSINDKMVVNTQNIGLFWDFRKDMIKSASKTIKTQKLVSKLAYVWLEQALFGSAVLGSDNFHHGDMHAGNIMCDGKDTTILDYGNAVILKDSKVNQILSMLTSVVIESSKDFVEAFNTMLELSAKDEEKSKNKVGYAPLNEQQQKEFITKLDELFKLGTAEDTGKKILVALNIAQSLGVKLPKEIQNFSQCQQRLENTLLEVKNTAIRASNMVDKMDNMNVAPKDMKSPDPMIKLHLFLQDPENRFGEDIEAFSDRYNTYSKGPLTESAKKAKTQNAMDDALKKDLPLYGKLKALITPERSRALATECRQVLKEASEYSKRGEKVPRELLQKIWDKAGELNLLHDKTDSFGGFMDLEYYSDLVNKVFTHKDYNYSNIDEAAFENVMVIFEEIIPTMLEGVDKLYGTLSDVSKDAKKEKQRQTNVSQIVSEATRPLILFNREAMDYRRRIRDSKDDEKKKEFERQNARMLKSHNFKVKYNDYRDAESELDKLSGSGDQAKINEAQKKLQICESELVAQFMSEARLDIKDVSKDFESNISNENLMDDDFMPDFVSVMGYVVQDHWLRSAMKINKALAVKVKSRAKEKEKLDNIIENEKKAEEALKKGRGAAKKK